MITRSDFEKKHKYSCYISYEFSYLITSVAVLVFIHLRFGKDVKSQSELVLYLSIIGWKGKRKEQKEKRNHSFSSQVRSDEIAF